MLEKGKIFSNKIILYISSRYLTYFIQFLTAVWIAVKLGPFFFGIYGFLLLIKRYLSLIDFGIPQSTNVLYVQNKNNENKIKEVVANAFLLTSIISLVIALTYLIYCTFNITWFEKYSVNKYLYLVFIWAIIGHFNILFIIIYRIKNSLFEIAFQQTFTPTLVFISLFFSKGKNLLYVILFVSLFAELVSLLLFIVRGKVPFGGKISKLGIKNLVSKGIYLFIYISSMSLILISVRSIVSAYYQVENFGYFTFSFSLANTILLFLHAFSFIIMPKVIDKLHSNNTKSIFSTINRININYVTLTYLTLFLVLIIFPYLLNFIPQYKDSLSIFNMIALTIMLYTNSFSYSSFLMAQNKEKLLAIISLIVLLINVLFSLLLTYVLNIQIQFVILSTMLSYYLFGFLCSYFTHKYLSGKVDLKIVAKHFFPLRLFIPYATSIVIVLTENRHITFIPFILFILFNYKELHAMTKSIRLIISKPDLIDLK